jgi:hypothetical protein
MDRMKNATLVQKVAVCLAAVGFCMPQIALARTPMAKKKPVISDVRLQKDNVLVGQVVTPENKPVAGTKVLLHSGKKQLAAGKTDKNGLFAFSGLKRGVYQVSAAKGQGSFRVWSWRTAPPAAQPGALIIADNGTVRGQNGMRTFRNFMSNPLVIAGIVATAIVIPVAIHNSDRTPSSP